MKPYFLAAFLLSSSVSPGVSFADGKPVKLDAERIIPENEAVVLARDSSYKCVNASNKTAVIRTREQLNAFREGFKRCADLAKLGAIDIDFEKNILLAQHALKVGSEFFRAQVTKDDTNRTVTYELMIYSKRGRHMGSGIATLGLVSVPKFPKDYKVVFKMSPLFSDSVPDDINDKLFSPKPNDKK